MWGGSIGQRNQLASLLFFPPCNGDLVTVCPLYPDLGLLTECTLCSGKKEILQYQFWGLCSTTSCREWRKVSSGRLQDGSAFWLCSLPGMTTIATYTCCILSKSLGSAAVHTTHSSGMPIESLCSFQMKGAPATTGPSPAWAELHYVFLAARLCLWLI